MSITNATMVAVFYGDSYFKYASINDEGKIGTWIPGAPEAFDNFVIEKTGQIAYGEISEGVKYLEPKGYTIIFETEPCVQEISDGIKTKPVNFPCMLWVYNKKKASLHLYIKKKDDYYAACFSNISVEGTVCIGTSPHPTSYEIPQIIEQIKEMFFNGKFSVIKEVKSYKKKYTWKELLKLQNI
jgi:hypothetical protein